MEDVQRQSIPVHFVDSVADLEPEAVFSCDPNFSLQNHYQHNERETPTVNIYLAFTEKNLYFGGAVN